MTVSMIMNRKSVACFIALCWLQITGSLHAQNLVPNYSFEYSTYCPYAPGQINSAFGWNDAYGNTADFFHPCGNAMVSAPVNSFGGQAAADGISYIGFRAYTSGNPTYFEFPAIELTAPLDSCQTYAISFKVSRGAGDQGGGWATDQLGIAFFNSVQTQSAFADQLWGFAPGPIVPAFTSPPGQVITDSTGWTTISATYVAQGGEVYLVIGNFQFTNTIPVWTGTGSDFSAYYFVDDVHVERTSSLLGQNVSICEGDSVTFNMGRADSILWSDGSSDPYFTITDPGTYWVTTSIRGCTFTDTIVVDVHSYPDFSLGNDTTICEGATFSIGTNVQGAYQWNTGSTDQTIVPDASGTYTLTVNWDGCIGTDEIHVEFEDCIFIPNAFSPNGDGQNDVLYVRGYESGYFHFVVFDRWGTKVFETYDPAIGWDGTVSNQPGVDGVYNYYAELDSQEHGGRYMKKGNVSLIR